jgi:hypothetical protein
MSSTLTKSFLPRLVEMFNFVSWVAVIFAVKGHVVPKLGFPIAKYFVFLKLMITQRKYGICGGIFVSVLSLDVKLHFNHPWGG